MFLVFFRLLSQAQDAIIEVQLNNVWVTGIVGNPVYVACKHCRTKIDAETGHCKRHDTHSCQTERDEEMAILATVNLADHTGEIERILADEKSLCALAGVAAKSQLLTLLEKSGSQAICFKNPVDVRLATNMRKSSNVRSNVPEATHGVLQTQESESAATQLPECQFQVVAAQSSLCKEYNDAHRPMVRKILRLENQRAVGMVYPIACPYEDLLFSGFGVKLKDAAIFPGYVSFLVRANDDEPTIKKSGAAENEVYMMQHNDVVAVEARVPKAFRVESFCQLQQSHHFNMADHKIHFLVGKVTADDDKGTSLTVVAEKIFKLNTDQQQQALQAERLGIADAQLSTTRKRPASDLVIETPAKVRAGKWTDA